VGYRGLPRVALMGRFFGAQLREHGPMTTMMAMKQSKQHEPLARVFMISFFRECECGKNKRHCQLYR
jgi:hypothetical protein